MPILQQRRRFMIRVLTTVAATTASGCGSILHPERVGQPRSGPLDWKIVALNGIGLVLFVVPGVIAFAVDFYNGTIFLPPCGYAQIEPTRTDELVAIEVRRKELTHEKIEQVVSEHSNKEIELTAGNYETKPLSAIDQFWNVASQMREAFS